MVLFCKCHHCVFHEYVITISNSNSEEFDPKSNPDAKSVVTEDVNANVQKVDNDTKPDTIKNNSNTKEDEANDNTKNVEAGSELNDTETKNNASEAKVDANVEQPETVIDAEQADINVLNELINPDEEKTNVET